LFCREGEKVRRWQEIKIRQHRLLSDSDQVTPAHIEQIMKSGFSLSDIKGKVLKHDFFLKNILVRSGQAYSRTSYKTLEKYQGVLA